MSNSPVLQDAYALADSGDGVKLERFGDITLIRPSSLCIWAKRKPKLWANASAEYLPKQGWKFHGKQISDFQIKFSDITLILRLQQNGQVGFFPEHALLLNPISKAIESCKKAGKSAPRVLNLFAFTGMASIWCAQRGCDVTHVDMAKSALTWAEQNFKANNISANRVRLIPEDALKFVEREIKRESRYDIIVADPPGFSRISKNSVWNVEDVVSKLVIDCCRLLPENSGTLVFSSHSSGLTKEVLGNLILDARDDIVSVTPLTLNMQESDSNRILPGGHAVVATF